MKEAFIKLHISILLAGLTGLFGKLVHLHQLPMVWYRVFFALAILYAVLAVGRKIQHLGISQIVRIGGVGVLLALHWVFFFGSIKASNISVGVICYSLVGVFTAILEPYILHTRYSWRDLSLSVLTVAGIALIFKVDTHYQYGIILGVISSLFASLFTIYNKMVVDRYHPDPSTMLLYELLAGVLVLTPIIGVYVYHDTSIVIVPTVSDFVWLLLLSSLCTIGLQLLQIDALKQLSAFTVNLSYNLEPIYTIIIAMTVFHEARTLSWAFFTGLTLIILSVLAKTLLIIRQQHSVKLT